MNCIFCHERPDGRRLTLEHVLSKPVRRAFGITDDTQIGRIDSDGGVVSFARADQFTVRLPCGSCNSGWMSALEVELVRSIRRWQKSQARLGRSQSLAVKRWCLKTYIILSAVEGSIRKMTEGDETPLWRVMPEATRARLLAVEDNGAFKGVKFGASLVANSSRLYGFGNPDIRSPHGGLTPNVSAGALFVTLGNLRLWTVVAFDRDAQVRLPPGIAEVRSHLRYRRLKSVADTVGVSDAVVLNSRGLDAMAAFTASGASSHGGQERELGNPDGE